MDTCVMDQSRDPLVSGPILLTQKLGELNEELTAEHLVAMHVAHILELGLHWGRKWRGGGSRGLKNPHGAVKHDI